MTTILEFVKLGFSPSEAIEAFNAQGGTATPNAKPAEDRRPKTLPQYWFFLRALNNAFVAGSTKDGTKLTAIPDKALRDGIRKFWSENSPQGLKASQNPKPVAEPTTQSDQDCTFVLTKGARKDELCGKGQKVVLDGGPRCTSHAKLEQDAEATAKALNESEDGEGTVQSSNVKADKGPATEQVL